ncbi:ribbon-helix-helix domain-containing protein [Telmatospirillum sp. J64-1]|uniref:ribbon-helix-helix domain-containing protein n=1 Tax=Telmatospirillum sp. J64-1 TaxID=2502183 RepID=UPI00115D3AB4|nr:ribbon-helix-helix domain-containing protein [Telmatospirillum sp. J64-1]
MSTEVKKRSVIIAGHATSVSLEAEFWDELKAIADRRGLSLNQLITEIDQARAGNLSSAIRVFILRSLKEKAGAETPASG